MNTDVMFSSKSEEHETPEGFFNFLNWAYGPFDLDPAATAENTKGKAFFTKEDDGLRQRWFGRVYVNPPYGRNIGQWIGKAIAESVRDEVEQVVMLLPARTDTVWFHELVVPYAQRIIFIRGRLTFGRAEHAAPFPSMLVIFDRHLTSLAKFDTMTRCDKWPPDAL